MTTDDHDGDDPLQDRGDNDKPTRDARGRWLPGNCPNPKGRPKKKPKVLRGTSDIRIFGETLVDVVANGQKETMTRQTALLSKIFESAMKGRVSQQRFLYKEFEKNTKLLAATILHYERLMFDWIINDPAPGKPRVDMPLEVEMDIMRLRQILNHYYPGQYPPSGIPANDDSDDDDSDDDDG